MRNLITKILNESFKDFTLKVGEIAEIKTDDDGRDMAGKTCTIVYVNPTILGEGDENPGVLVKVDGWNRGHAGDGPPCGNRDCWWVRYQNLRPFVDYEQTNSAFDKLYEQKNEGNDLTVNDLLCYREDPHNKASDFTKNKCYPIEFIDYDDNSLGIINDAGSKTTWSIYNRSGYNYEDWFYVMPKDIQNMDFFKGLYEQEDELEWARDLVSGVENYWDVFKQRIPKNLDELKFKLIPKSNGSEYFKESLDSCSFNGNLEWWYKQTFRIGKIRQMVRSGSDCEAGLVFDMDVEEDVLSAQLVECLTGEYDYDLPFWINEDMVDIIVVE